MKTWLLFSILSFCTSALADSCRPILLIETDDSIYPGQGSVQICTNDVNQLTKLVVIKPVQNPGESDPDSVQPDERKPVLHMTLEQINTARRAIPIMTPQRLGIQVNAAYLEVPTVEISKDQGGEVVLKVLKNKILNSYHYFRLSLVKVNKEWKAFLVRGNQKVPLSHAYFVSGKTGIRRVDFF